MLRCRAVFEELEKLEGCTVLRHEKNQGKGRAMKDAFAYILDQPRWAGCAVVTADADGQHSVEDVCAVGRTALEHPEELTLGVRDLTLPEVPPKSRVGNRLSSWAFRTLYGPRLEDTQTGLRGIPWDLLDWCRSIRGLPLVFLVAQDGTALQLLQLLKDRPAGRPAAIVHRHHALRSPLQQGGGVFRQRSVRVQRRNHHDAPSFPASFAAFRRPFLGRGAGTLNKS